MKRFFAFCGDNYYPSGGMDDFIGDFDTVEEAISAVTAKVENDFPDDERKAYQWRYHWAHIWDCQDNIEVWDK